MTPVPDTPGSFQADWTAEKPGSYVAEVTAQRGDQELGRDVLTFQRMDGVAENFHTEQNRDLLEKLAVADRRALLAPAGTFQARQRNSLFRGRHHGARDERAVGHADHFPADSAVALLRMAAAPEVGDRVKRARMAGLCARGCCFCWRCPRAPATYYVTVAGLGGEPDYEQRFTAMANDLDKLLKASGSDAHVYTLTGDEATRAHLTRNARRRSPSEAKPDDDFVLILIGHGILRRRRVQIQSRRPGYFRRGTGRAVRPHSRQAPVDREHHQRQRRLDCRASKSRAAP